MSTNRGIINTIKRGSERYKRTVDNNEVPSLVCKACGDFSLYINHVYNFSTKQSVELLNLVSKIKKEIKEKDLVCCQTCAVDLGIKKEYEKTLTKEDKEIMLKATKKHMCKKCISKISNEFKIRDKVSVNK